VVHEHVKTIAMKLRVLEAKEAQGEGADIREVFYLLGFAHTMSIINCSDNGFLTGLMPRIHALAAAAEDRYLAPRSQDADRQMIAEC
jgi:hypothetical protein